MNRIAKKAGKVLVALILIALGAVFFKAIMVAVDPSSYKYECPAITVKDQFGNAHVVLPEQTI